MNPSVLYDSQLIWTLLLVAAAGAGIAALEWRERSTRRARQVRGTARPRR
jgi:hypothetical protein